MTPEDVKADPCHKADAELRILVISGSPWSASNSFGSTYQPIFEAVRNASVWSVYCAPGAPDLDTLGGAFQITENSLMRNLLKRSLPSGGEPAKPSGEGRAGSASSTRLRRLDDMLDVARAHRFYFYPLARLARAIIWRIGHWASPELECFIRRASPDLIFVQMGNASHLGRIALWAQKLTGAPLAAHLVDDLYSLRQFSLSPFYWVTRFRRRHQLREIVAASSLCYAITEQQREEYQRTLGHKWGMLTKVADFSNDFETAVDGSDEEQVWFTYAGNVGNGRVDSLRRIGLAIEHANQKGLRGRLRIYTMTPLTGHMRQRLDLPTIDVHGPVDSDALTEIYGNSSVLVLVEPATLRGRLSVRLSFSTKIVEYMKARRCILAYGTGGMASLAYLKENGAAIVLTKEDAVDVLVEDAIRSPEIRRNCAVAAWELGRRSHDSTLIGLRLENEFREAICRMEHASSTD